MHERGEMSLLQLYMLHSKVDKQKRQMEARFAVAQRSLLLEEEQLKHNGDERHAFVNKIASFERELQAADTKCAQ